MCFHRLPVFKKDDRQLVKGTYDFFAISHFSTKLVTHAKEDSYDLTPLDTPLCFNMTSPLSRLIRNYLLTNRKFFSHSYFLHLQIHLHSNAWGPTHDWHHVDHVPKTCRALGTEESPQLGKTVVMVVVCNHLFPFAVMCFYTEWMKTFRSDVVSV